MFPFIWHSGKGTDYKDRDWICSYQRLGVEGGFAYTAAARRNNLEWGTFPYSDCSDGFKTLFVKNHKTVLPKTANFIVNNFLNLHSKNKILTIVYLVVVFGVLFFFILFSAV